MKITVGTKLVNDKIEDIKVSVVDSFKLLGVSIDNKLNFTEHCSNLKKIVNKKVTGSSCIRGHLNKTDYRLIRYQNCLNI
jgi:hypothetical protein